MAVFEFTRTGPKHSEEKPDKSHLLLNFKVRKGGKRGKGGGGGLQKYGEEPFGVGF